METSCLGRAETRKFVAERPAEKDEYGTENGNGNAECFGVHLAR
jgi:hypothetical protein